MTYATPADMAARFGARELRDLTDREQLGDTDDAVAQVALDSASAEIDGYLARAYALPLGSTPTLLVGICCDLARYILSGSVAVDTESMRARAKDARALLERIARTEVKLGLPTALAPTITGPTVISARGRSRLDGALGEYSNPGAGGWR